MVRKMGQLGEVLLIGRHHIVGQVLQLARIGTRHHSRRIVMIVHFRRQTVVNETTTLRMHRVRVRVVRVGDIADAAVLGVRSVDQHLLVALGSLRSVLLGLLG